MRNNNFRGPDDTIMDILFFVLGYVLTTLVILVLKAKGLL